LLSTFDGLDGRAGAHPQALAARRARRRHCQIASPVKTPTATNTSGTTPPA